MDIELKKHILLESFDAIKDSWDIKSNAIEKAISRMFDIDEEMAIEMWLYILRKNKRDLKDNSYALIGSVLYCMERTGGCSDDIKEEQIAKRLANNKELCEFLYGFNCDLGSAEIHYIGWFIALNMNDTVNMVLNLIENNSHLNEYKIGKIISYAISKLDYIDDAHISEQTKEILYNFSNRIEDKLERAEAMIAITSL